MNSTRMLVVLAFGLSLMAACGDDGTIPPPPPKPPQIEYNLAHTRSTGLPSNEVTSFIDVNAPGGDRFWVGTRAGIALFSGPGDTDVDSVVTEITGLPHPQVTDMIQHGNAVYVGTWGGGLGVYNVQLNSWDQLVPGEAGLTDGFISGLAVSESEDRIYCSSNDGVFIYDPALGTFTHQSTVDPDLPDGDFETPALQQLASCVEVMDSLGVVERWYGPRVELRPSEIDPSMFGILVSKAATSYRYTMTNSGLKEPNVNDIFWDRTTNRFWVAYASKGVSLVNTEARTWTGYDLSDGLPSNTVMAVTRAIDHQSNNKSAIWVATQGGLAKLVDGTTNWQSYDVSGGLPSARTRSVYNDGTHLWVGFVDAGAVRIK